MTVMITPQFIISETHQLPGSDAMLTAREYNFIDSENTRIAVFEMGGLIMDVCIDGVIYDDPETSQQKNSVRGLVVDAILNAVLRREAAGQTGVTQEVITSLFESPS